MSATDKDIRYSITAEDRFSRTFSNLRRDVAGAGAALGSMVSKAGAVSLALGGLSLAGLAGVGSVGIFKRLADELDALNDASDSTGSTVEKLSALEDVGRRTGAGLETVVAAVLKLNKNLVDTKPDSPAALALERIGLSAAELRKQDPSDALVSVAKALGGFADDGEKARLVLELTGKEAKTLAPLLKDLSEAGELSAKVTADQAAQAEIFNKELFNLQTNASNAARALASQLLPVINQLFAEARSGGLSKVLGLDTFGAQIDQAIAAYRLIGLARERITPLSILEKDPTNQRAITELARIDALAQGLAATFKKANTERLKLSDGSAGSGRGFINPPLIKPAIEPAKPPPAKPASATTSEAERYLVSLQKQGEKLQDLSVYQQLLADIENKRIDGITPKLNQELRLAAQRVDLQRQINTEKEREVGFQKLLSDKPQRDIDEVQRLLAGTDTGRLKGLESQTEKLLDFSRKIDADDPRQRQVLEAMKRLRDEAADITKPAEEATTAYDKLADTIEKSMDRATGAIIDMVVNGKASVGDLGRAFGRDVLRALIEDPVRDTMKQVTASIRSVFKGSGGIDELLSGLGGAIGGLFGGGNSFAGAPEIGGYGTRALGGPVNAGGLYRWQENGREWFVPDQNGTVVNKAQMASMAGGGAVQQTNNFTINGGNPADVQRQIEAALARNNAQILRSRNTGGAFAGA